MRGDQDEIHVPLLSYTHNLSRSVAVNNQLINFKPGTFLTLGNLRQLALRRILELIRNISQGKRLSHPRVSHRRYNLFYDMHTNDSCAELSRQRCGVGERIVTAFTEIRRKQDRTNLHLQRELEPGIGCSETATIFGSKRKNRKRKIKTLSKTVPFYTRWHLFDSPSTLDYSSA